MDPPKRLDNDLMFQAAIASAVAQEDEKLKRAERNLEELKSLNSEIEKLLHN